MSKYEVPDYQAKICAAFSQGNMGKAIRMATSSDFNAMHEEVLHLLKNIDNMEVHDIMNEIKNLSEYKVDIYDVIDMMMIWYRDIMMLKITNDPNLLIFQQEPGRSANGQKRRPLMALI